MSNEFEVYIEIPKIAGKIEIPNDQKLTYIGKREIKNSVVKSLSDPKALDSISSVRTDKDTGAIIKQQFIISKVNDKYFIEDPNSSNGTYLENLNLKQNPPTQLKNGAEIVVPIEENGELIQLKMYFHIEKKKSDPLGANLDMAKPKCGYCGQKVAKRYCPSIFLKWNQRACNRI